MEKTLRPSLGAVHMAYLKQVFEQRAGIEGGLLFGSMLQMRDIPINGATNGEVAAYLSGLRSTKVGNTPRPALALGVSNFGTARESEVHRLTATMVVGILVVSIFRSARMMASRYSISPMRLVWSV